MRKKQSLGLRLKKLFSSEGIIEEYFALHYTADFSLTHVSSRNRRKGSKWKTSKLWKERQEDLENVGYYFIKMNLDKPEFDAYEELVK